MSEPVCLTLIELDVFNVSWAGHAPEQVALYGVGKTLEKPNAVIRVSTLVFGALGDAEILLIGFPDRLATALLGLVHVDTVFLHDDEEAVEEATSAQSETPLHFAISHNYDDVVGLVLEHGANVNAQGYCGRSPLHAAITKGNDGTVDLIVHKEGDVNELNDIPQSPLNIAAESGNEAVVKLLLAKGADINARLSSGETPLSLASWNGRQETVKVLQERMRA